MSFFDIQNHGAWQSGGYNANWSVSGTSATNQTQIPPGSGCAYIEVISDTDIYFAEVLAVDATVDNTGRYIPADTPVIMRNTTGWFAALQVSAAGTVRVNTVVKA